MGRWKYRQNDLLEFIRKHPGLTATQMKMRLGSDVRTTLAKLVKQNEIVYDFINPKNIRKGKRYYINPFYTCR